jgi:hypothetical protein
VQEADGDAPILFGENLRRHGESDHLISRRQHDLVAWNVERPIEHERLAVQVVALRILVGLDETGLSPLAGLAVSA